MKTFKPFEQVVHKALGNEPMVVIPRESFINTEEGQVVVRRAVISPKFGTHFEIEVFWADELETPVESIEREAEIFMALNAKKEEINARQETKAAKGISLLN